MFQFLLMAVQYDIIQPKHQNKFTSLSTTLNQRNDNEFFFGLLFITHELIHCFITHVPFVLNVMPLHKWIWSLTVSWNFNKLSPSVLMLHLHSAQKSPATVPQAQLTNTGTVCQDWLLDELLKTKWEKAVVFCVCAPVVLKVFLMRQMQMAVLPLYSANGENHFKVLEHKVNGFGQDPDDLS